MAYKSAALVSPGFVRQYRLAAYEEQVDSWLPAESERICAVVDNWVPIVLPMSCCLRWAHPHSEFVFQPKYAPPT